MHRGLLRDVLAGTSKGAAPRAGLLSTPRSMSVPGCVWFYLAPPPRLSCLSCDGVCCPGPGCGIPRHGPAWSQRPDAGVVPSPMESVTRSGELLSDISSPHPFSHA